MNRPVFPILLFAVLVSGGSVRAQGTAFTYQGRLSTAASPANGIYDFRFALWDAESAGTMLGSAATNAGVIMSGGSFAVTLDFGNFFDGSGRWIELGVRTNGSGTFTSLSPRQRLTPAPYSIYAGAVNAAGINGTISASN